MFLNNRAAYLDKAGTVLEIRDAPLPQAGPGEIVVKNAAVAINPLDWHMADHGVFVQQWPAILGCDVAGEVYEVGSGVARFKVGDRVIGYGCSCRARLRKPEIANVATIHRHTINLTSGRPQDGAFQLYSTVSAKKAAVLPDSIAFADGVVVPFALEAAVCALSLKEPGTAMPGVSTPALGLPYPSVEGATPTGKTVVVFGASSSVGSMTTQIAAAAGISVITIAGPDNQELCKSSGATQFLSHHDPSIVEKVVRAVTASGQEFVGIFDSVAIRETFDVDLEILAKLGGGHLALTHPPVGAVPENVKAGMIFAVNDVADLVWEAFVTPALAGGKLRCLPLPTVVGKGLEYVQEGLQRSKVGVSGTKLVIAL